MLILEKANICRSGAIAMGMDGVNTTVIPGHSTPEQYVYTDIRTEAASALNELITQDELLLLLDKLQSNDVNSQLN
ncbi:hypothetical protein [uncultured Nostoc sp.]|uniref:hypothetical protein n=1 Tax=uncultured Nostoc sp. TaxID=340711 RepID=UPI0035CC65B1